MKYGFYDRKKRAMPIINYKQTKQNNRLKAYIKFDIKSDQTALNSLINGNVRHYFTMLLAPSLSTIISN